MQAQAQPQVGLMARLEKCRQEQLETRVGVEKVLTAQLYSRLRLRAPRNKCRTCFMALIECYRFTSDKAKVRTSCSNLLSPPALRPLGSEPKCLSISHHRRTLHLVLQLERAGSTQDPSLTKCRHMRSSAAPSFLWASKPEWHCSATTLR